MLLFIDNFDSFTYNLVQDFRVLGEEVSVVRSDSVTVEQCLSLQPDGLVVGPGPGTPAGAGISKEAIAAFSGRVPILGVCLGHQAIAEVFGGHTVRALAPVHGKTSAIYHSGEGVFGGLSDGFVATRYHSLVVDRENLPDSLQMTAQTADGQIMGLRHRALAIEGVQFHPESVLCVEGSKLLANFVNTTNNILRNHDEKDAMDTSGSRNFLLYNPISRIFPSARTHIDDRTDTIDHQTRRRSP